MTYHLPLFPLPDAVLFPRTHQPLHIFEDRYRAMITHVMNGDRKLLGMAHLREGYQENYFGCPAVFRVVTAARVLFADRLEDGRWNILIEGVERVRIIDEIQQSPFRVAQVESLPDEVDPKRKPETEALMLKLAEFAEQLAASLGEERRILTNLVNTYQHPGIVCDVVASRLVADPYARQSILNERDLIRRLRLTMIQVQSLIRDLANSGTEMDLPSRD
jgi:Lon protease-like protein